MSRHAAGCMDAALQRAFGERYSSGSCLLRVGYGGNQCCLAIQRLLPPRSRKRTGARLGVRIRSIAVSMMPQEEQSCLHHGPREDGGSPASATQCC